MSKRARHARIIELVNGDTVASQDELRRRLARFGIEVNQGTLSRDIHELGLVKTADGYAVPQGDNEPDLPSVTHLVQEFVRDVREAQNLLVIKTAVGSAQPVAAALDGEGWQEVVGTVAGDDTILIISPDQRSAHRLAERIREIVR